MEWRANDKIVFIGDSITEEGRFEDPESIGAGYVRLIHDLLLIKHPDLNLNILNKGIGGSRITDLAERWEKDVIDENPDWVSVSIGINDVWRQLDRPEIEQVFPDMFEQVYDEILKQVHQLTSARLIIMEPTLIEENADSEGNRLLRPYVEASQKLAERYSAVLIPEHQAFLTYLKANNQIALTTDGVHMNSKGDMLMATTWLNTMDKCSVLKEGGSSS
ncbi:SGNH/GDSL hydrolase family protein [Alteribacillus sp. HJP-4]|uniref:SGNH/GDSL hydrolase family protein n=1 Tax=Alteribacillus sp. HJP-4 TaxID=2775394 RepID=UPI0035CD3149